MPKQRTLTALQLLLPFLVQAERLSTESNANILGLQSQLSEAQQVFLCVYSFIKSLSKMALYKHRQRNSTPASL
jgi:hypothetical protein